MVEELVKVDNKTDLGNGNYFEGNIVNGKYEGEGILKLDNLLYKCCFKNGKKEGRGKICFYLNNKLLFDGIFSNDMKIEGKCFLKKGIEFFEDGSKYTGQYRNNLKDGNGMLEI